MCVSVHVSGGGLDVCVNVPVFVSLGVHASVRAGCGLYLSVCACVSRRVSSNLSFDVCMCDGERVRVTVNEGMCG